MTKKWNQSPAQSTPEARHLDELSISTANSADNFSFYFKEEEEIIKQPITRFANQIYSGGMSFPF